MKGLTLVTKARSIQSSMAGVSHFGGGPKRNISFHSETPTSSQLETSRGCQRCKSLKRRATHIWPSTCPSNSVRPKRDFRPQQLYAITQRGNQGQWVYRDAEDFTKALDLIRKYATLHQVAVHGWCLLHNHGHWIFEASTTDSISNLMRDMQSRYSHYLNTKYTATPWLLIAPLYGCRDLDHFSPYLRMGPGELDGMSRGDSL